MRVPGPATGIGRLDTTISVSDADRRATNRPLAVPDDTEPQRSSRMGVGSINQYDAKPIVVGTRPLAQFPRARSGRDTSAPCVP